MAHRHAPARFLVCCALLHAGNAQTPTVTDMTNTSMSYNASGSMSMTGDNMTSTGGIFAAAAEDDDVPWLAWGIPLIVLAVALVAGLGFLAMRGGVRADDGERADLYRSADFEDIQPMTPEELNKFKFVPIDNDAPKQTGVF
eukprot:TRINITY_DN2176_c0_g2_i1.p1 TRINITY_DN2176_c0_g2~~TRINITY_DN2176_c0_g2_i1.p1  ORF type:complete len:163 (+),score=53.93 TRINITY_DN2176_c0_g2_i1:64-489(+)